MPKTQRPTGEHRYKHVHSPVGMLTLVATDRGLAAILWPNRPGPVRLSDGAEAPDHPVLVEAERQLEEYFAGRRTRFELTLDLEGTAFQRRVWQALLTIPYGETRSYAQIARQIGSPGSARAVGAANGRNPLSVVVPCHRVIGSTGALTGFGGGLEVKARLLEHEGNRAFPSLVPPDQISGQPAVDHRGTGKYTGQEGDARPAAGGKERQDRLV